MFMELILMKTHGHSTGTLVLMKISKSISLLKSKILYKINQKISKKIVFIKFHPFLRQESVHIVQEVAFEDAKLKILGEDDQKYFTQSEIKQGGKYQIQIDLEEELASNCQECIFGFFENFSY